MKYYILNHGLNNRFFTEKEITGSFLTYLDDLHFNVSIVHYETTIFLSLAYVDNMYEVLAIAGIIDQLGPTTRQPTRKRSNGISTQEGR